MTTNYSSFLDKYREKYTIVGTIYDCFKNNRFVSGDILVTQNEVSIFLYTKPTLRKSVNTAYVKLLHQSGKIKIYLSQNLQHSAYFVIRPKT